MILIVVRQEVSNFDSSVVMHEMHELELAINRALYGFLCYLGSQYNVGSLSWSSLILTANLVALWKIWLLMTDFSFSEVCS